MDIINSQKVISCFYDASQDCVKVINTQGILLSFNDNGLKVMEIDNASDVIGKSWLSFWTGDLKIPAEKALNEALAGEPSYFQGYCPTFKGTMKFWKVSLIPVSSDSGTVESILVTSQDNTREAELEKKVAELQAKLFIEK